MRWPMRVDVCSQNNDHGVAQYDILRLIEHVEVDRALAFVAGARLCGVDGDVLGSRNWFPYEFKTGKPSRVGGSMPMVRKLADGTEVKIAGTEAVRPILCDEFATSDMSFGLCQKGLATVSGLERGLLWGSIA